MSYTLRKNDDIQGLKEYINEWLISRNLDSLYGLINSSAESKYVIPPKGYDVTYENQEYVEWLNRVYSRLSIDRIKDEGTFYWFKPFERAVEILKEQRLHLLSLEKQDSNDHTEALEFLQRYVYFPYSDRSLDTTISNNSKSHASGIACFTKNFRDQQFWSNYAKANTGVALGIRFNFKNDPLFKGHQPFILRDVYYDTGYDLDFLNELRYLTFKKFNVVLSIIPSEGFDLGLRWMRYYYKRDKYRWENETRLSFDIIKYLTINVLFKEQDGIEFQDRMETHGIESHFADKSRPDFLMKVAFDNPFFQVKVDEVICGANVCDKHVEELKELTKGEVHVWRRQIG